MPTLLLAFASSLIALTSCVTDDTAQPLFRYQDDEVAIQDLSTQRQRNLYKIRKQYYDAVKSEITDIVIERYVREAAKARKTDIEAIRHELLGNIKPSAFEIKMFYDQNRDSILYPYKVAKLEIEQILIKQKLEEKRAALVPRIQEEADVFVYMEVPRPPLASFNTQQLPRKGSPNAKVQLVQFADLTCPVCKLSDPEVRKMVKDFGDEVAYTYAFFPLDSHGKLAINYALGGHCAHRQKKFWPYLRDVYDHQYALERHPPEKIAAELQLDQKAFARCYASPETRQFVMDWHKQGSVAGVTGTPAFFVNGKLIAHGHQMKKLKSAIESEL